MQFVSTLQKRLAKEQSGFTLIELLVVLVIIGVLLAIAVPSYLGFKERAERRAAASNVRSAIPAAEAWYSDHTLGYSGMSAATLRSSYDAGISATLTVVGATTSAYCLQDTKGAYTYSVDGPGGTITAGAC